MSLLKRLLGLEPKSDAKTCPNPMPATPPTDASAEPVAKPQPSMDGKKPIPSGTDEVEKFMVTTDTGGGD
jgi:hypothetical protein